MPVDSIGASGVARGCGVEIEGTTPIGGDVVAIKTVTGVTFTQQREQIPEDDFVHEEMGE